MIKPIRIQRSRQHKQISPNGLEIKYCGRATKWGNPFKIVGDMIYIDASWRIKDKDPWVYFCQGDLEKCVRLYECVVTGNACTTEREDKTINLKNLDDVLYWVKHFMRLDISDLKAKNLSCWCKTGNICHADVLIKLSNKTLI